MNKMKYNKIAIFTLLPIALMVVCMMTTLAMTEHFTDAAGTVGDNTWKEWKTNWETIKTSLEQISLTPGADQTQLNFCWYSHTATANPVIKWATKADMSNSKTFFGTQTPHRIINGVQYYSSKVTVSGLTENTTYYYQFENNGIWSTPVRFSTKGFSNFKLIDYKVNSA